MRIGILSDIHDHVWHLDRALEAMHGVEALIFCGDLCSPFVMGQLGAAQAIEGPIHAVFGNNDGDLFRITQNAAKQPQRIHLHGEMAELELGGERFAVTHYPHIATSLAASGRYDVVCYGHNHAHHVERGDIGGRHVIQINPGTLMGARFDRGKREKVPVSFAIYDTEARRVDSYTIQPAPDEALTELKVEPL